MENNKIKIKITNPITGYKIPIEYEDPLSSIKANERLLKSRKKGKIIEYIPEIKGGYIKSDGHEYVFSIEELCMNDRKDEKEFKKNPNKFLIGKTVTFRSHWILGVTSYMIAYWILFEIE